MKSRPTIAVTGPDRGGWPAWIFTAWAVWRAGGRPRRVTPSRSRLPEPVHGVILGGGADVGPGVLEMTDDDILPDAPARTGSLRAWLRYFGALARALVDLVIGPAVFVLRRLASRRGHRRRTDEARDRLERAILRRAEADGLPVLGICRGAQLMNRFRGGTLLEDLEDHYEERPQMDTVLPRRPVVVDAPSRLLDALGARRLCVNSLHRHAVGEPGRRLRISAREPRGVVQGIESVDDPMWLGVQWHPEYLPQVPAQRGLFSAVVEAAARRTCAAAGDA